MSSLNEHARPKRTGSVTPTRRQAIGTAATIGAASALALPQASCAAEDSQPQMLRARFQPWYESVGQPFQIIDQKTGMCGTLQLEQVIEHLNYQDRCPAQLRQNSLVLIFSASRALKDANYLVRHPQLGSATIFVHATRSGQQAERTVYQVVLN